MDEKFWTEDPSIIYKNYYIIIPTVNMTRIEQLNTCTRFLIYFIILCILFNASQTIVIYLLIAIIMIIIFYYIYITDPIGIENDLISETESSEKKFIENEDNIENFDLNAPMVNIYDSVKNKVFKGNSIPTLDFESQSGYIDSDGNYKIGPNYTDINYKDYVKNKNKEKKKKLLGKKTEYIEKKIVENLL